MAVNLLELTKGHITKEVGYIISALTEESTGDVQAALLGTLPGLIGAIMNKASTSGGVHELIGLMHLNNEDYVLRDLAGVLSDPDKSKDLITMGLSLLPMILDADLKIVTDSISASTGLKNYSVSNILSISAPIVLSVVGKQVKDKTIDPLKLTTLLVGQKEHILKYLPKDLAALWNFSGLEELNKNLQRNPVSEHHLEHKPVSGKRMLGYLVAAILFLVVIVWGYKKLNRGEETVVVEDFSADTVGAKKTANVPVSNTPVRLISRELPRDIELIIPERGTEARLLDFIEDSSQVVDKEIWIDFDRIVFAPNKAELNEESREQVDNIADIMKAYPNLNIKIGGYTDNTGDAAGNLNLSKNRADAVKKGITKNNIKASRIQSEGYGIEHPIESNDTEEGRAKNRRIAINVTRK
jgi:OOP family OmpA-OmpF porin